MCLLRRGWREALCNFPFVGALGCVLSQLLSVKGLVHFPAAGARRQGKSVREAVQDGIDAIEDEISLEAAKKLNWESLASPLNLASPRDSVEFKKWYDGLLRHIEAGPFLRFWRWLFGID